MPKVGVLLCGHGTRNAQGAQEFLDLAASVKQCLDGLDVTAGFMELAEPTFDTGLDQLREAGCRTIVVAPAMLFGAGHLKFDLPAMLRAYAAQHPGLDLRLGEAFGVDARMVRAAADRVRAAVPAPAEAVGSTVDAAANIGPEDTGLLMVARGSSDPDANADAMKMMRLLWEGLGFGWAEIGYCDVTFPHVVPSLDRLAGQGHKRILVLPYLLFDGILIGRLGEWVAAAAAQYPGVAFALAPYLNDHPEIVRLYADRVREAVRGETASDCCVCKYRSPLPGFEGDAPMAGAGDNTNASGIADLEKRPYPFAAHRYGPPRRANGGGTIPVR